MKCKYCDETHKNENTGCYNSGDWNSGYRNSGDSNSGNRNSGYWNSGYWNSGDSNSGDSNSGDRNSGYWNSGDFNVGFFNTGRPDKIMVFNKWLDMSREEFLDKYSVYADLPLNRWVDKEDMTEEEKSNIEGYEQMGGFLRTLDFKQACNVWWEENKDDHERFTSLPNFDSKIFEEITGIDIEVKEDLIEIDGKKWSKSTIKEALKNHAS